MYNEKGRGVLLDPMRPRFTGPIRQFQQGFRERLLCVKCEGLIAREYETPFKEFWYGAQSNVPGLVQTVGVDGRIIVVPDVRRFGLFHLSVLWRAGVSGLPQFAEVQLGNYHEERIRDLLLGERPFDVNLYPIYAVAAASPAGGVWHDIVFPPKRAELEGVRTYEFTFAGCAWFYVVSSHTTPLIRQIALKGDGQLPLVLKPIPSISKVYQPHWSDHGTRSTARIRHLEIRTP